VPIRAARRVSARPAQHAAIGMFSRCFCARSPPVEALRERAVDTANTLRNKINAYLLSTTVTRALSLCSTDRLESFETSNKVNQDAKSHCQVEEVRQQVASQGQEVGREEEEDRKEVKSGWEVSLGANVRFTSPALV